MDTLIGRELRISAWRWRTALGVGVLVVALDLVLNGHARLATDAYTRLATATWLNPDRLRAVYTEADYTAALQAYQVMMDAETSALQFARPLLALIAVLAYLALARGDRVSVGLTAAPRQGWRFWLTTGGWLGVVVIGAAVPLGLVWRQIGWGWDAVAEAFADNEWPLVDCVIRFPVFEEFIYRLAICVPIAARFGTRPAIAVSGSLFIAIHLIYGVANPVNVIAGFLLAWTFLKSNSIVVPILLHALGNLLFYLILLALGPSLAHLLI